MSKEGVLVIFGAIAFFWFYVGLVIPFWSFLAFGTPTKGHVNAELFKALVEHNINLPFEIWRGISSCNVWNGLNNLRFFAFAILQCIVQLFWILLTCDFQKMRLIINTLLDVMSGFVQIFTTPPIVV